MREFSSLSGLTCNKLLKLLCKNPLGGDANRCVWIKCAQLHAPIFAFELSSEMGFVALVEAWRAFKGRAHILNI